MNSDPAAWTAIPPSFKCHTKAQQPDYNAALSVILVLVVPENGLSRVRVGAGFSRSRPTTVGSAYTETCRYRGTHPAEAGAYTSGIDSSIERLVNPLL